MCSLENVKQKLYHKLFREFLQKILWQMSDMSVMSVTPAGLMQWYLTQNRALDLIP